MKPIVVPITQPLVNWHDYITNVNSITGKSPTRSLDSIQRSVGDYYSFIASLGFMSENLNPDIAVKFHDNLLKQLSFSFLFPISANDYLILLKETKLDYVDAGTTADNIAVIASGTLLDWKHACITLCREDVSFEIRYIFDFIYLHFIHLGLTEAFFGIGKKSISDKTFILEDLR